jgi:hypothetical protein
MVVPKTGEQKRDRMVDLIMNLEKVRNIREFMEVLK